MACGAACCCCACRNSFRHCDEHVSTSRAQFTSTVQLHKHSSTSPSLPILPLIEAIPSGALLLLSPVWSTCCARGRVGVVACRPRLTAKKERGPRLCIVTMYSTYLYVVVRQARANPHKAPTCTYPGTPRRTGGVCGTD